MTPAAKPAHATNKASSDATATGCAHRLNRGSHTRCFISGYCRNAGLARVSTEVSLALSRAATTFIGPTVLMDLRRMRRSGSVKAPLQDLTESAGEGGSLPNRHRPLDRCCGGVTADVGSVDAALRRALFSEQVQCSSAFGSGGLR